MYEQHFNLSQLPFSIAPDPSFLFLSTAHREALAHLMYGFSHGGFVMVTGEVGTGKTTLLRNLIKQTPPELDVAFILNPRLTVRELLATLCDELGIPYDVGTTTTVKQYIDLITRHLLETHRTGRSTVMIIDEAQNLSPAVLEQVRLLTNLETDDRKLLRIILIGQPELGELLERQDLRQLAQRITARYHLGSLNRPDTYAYVMHRMSRAGGNPHTFTQGALRRLYALSRGTPRLINVIADRALLGAYTEGNHQVTGRVVNRAAREVLGKPLDHRNWWLAAIAAASVAGAAWAILGPYDLIGKGGPAARPPELRVEEPAATGNSDPASQPMADPSPAQPSMQRMQAMSAEQVPAPAPDTGQDHAEEAPTAAAASVIPRSEPELPEAAADEFADSVITPATYAEMQAEMQAGGRAERQAAQRSASERQSLIDSASIGEPGTISRVTEISRPSGSAFANRRLAYEAIFARWGVDYQLESSDQIPCDFAPTAGLQCLSERGDWSEIKNLDLPVVLELWDGGASPYYAALIGFEGARLKLKVGSQFVETEQRALREQWSGSYVVLWQTPPGYYGSLRQGQRHETVGWLRQQLSALVEQSLASPTPNVFDQRLYEAVLEFQAEEGLLTDGIVGPATWIRLADRLQLPQPSLAG